MSKLGAGGGFAGAIDAHNRNHGGPGYFFQLRLAGKQAFFNFGRAMAR